MLRCRLYLYVRLSREWGLRVLVMIGRISEPCLEHCLIEACVWIAGSRKTKRRTKKKWTRPKQTWKSNGAAVKRPTFICANCGNVYLTEGNLRRHQNVRCVNKSKTFQCSFCPKMFYWKADMKKHCSGVHNIADEVLTELFFQQKTKRGTFQ